MKTLLIIFLCVFVFPLSAQEIVKLKPIDSIKLQLSDMKTEIEKLMQKIEEIEKGKDENKEELKKLKEELEILKEKQESMTSELRDKTQKLQNEILVEAKIREEEDKKIIDKFKPSVKFRLRPSYSDNRTDFNEKEKDNDYYYEQRLRLGIELKAIKKLSFFIQIQDARLWGEEEAPISNEKNLDLHQGYLLIADFPLEGLNFKFGRMKVGYGAERLIGRAEWSNIGRAFNGAEISYKFKDYIKATFFSALIHERRTPIGNDRNIYGLYLMSPYFKRLNLELYLFYLEDGIPDEGKKILTLNGRIFWEILKGLLLDAEASMQLGKNQEKGMTLDHFATAYYFDLSYTLALKFKPYFGFIFSSASGDGNPQDTRSVNYYPLYPSTHAPWGLIDLIEWSNIIDYGFKFGLFLLKDLKLSFEYHKFSLVAEEGPVFGFGGGKIPEKGVGNYVGQEFDTVISYKPSNSLELEFGYFFFLPGGVAKSILKNGDRADFLYFQTSLAF